MSDATHYLDRLGDSIEALQYVLDEMRQSGNPLRRLREEVERLERQLSDLKDENEHLRAQHAQDGTTIAELNRVIVAMRADLAARHAQHPVAAE